MEQIQHQLQQYFDGHEVAGLRQLALGWETDVYAFTLNGCPRVLRIYTGENAGNRPAAEVHAMRGLHRAGFPVPEVIGSEFSRERFGGPFVIMEQLPGEVMWRRFPDAYMGEQMLPLFTQLQVQLHKIDPFRFIGPHMLWQSPADAASTFEIDFLRMMVGLADLTQAFEPVLDRLAAWEIKVGRERRCLIHGDLHSENILMDDAGRIGVIDWSTAAIDDPRVDLAQTYVLEATQGRPRTAERVRASYEQRSGAPLRDFEFFTTLALARRAASVVVSLVGGAGLLGMRPGLERELRKDLPGIHKGIDLLSDWSGVALPEVHRVLDSL